MDLSNNVAITWICSIDSPHNAAVSSFLCLELGKESSGYGKSTIMRKSSISSKLLIHHYDSSYSILSGHMLVLILVTFA